MPDVYYTDFSKTLIPSDWFIMEKLEGKQRNEIKIDKAELNKKTAHMAAEIHYIKNDRFGYIQNGLYDNWYDALSNMIKNLLLDAQKMNKMSKRGEKLLSYAEKYKYILKAVPCSMVNYDIWDPNVICREHNNGEIEFQWIDPERSFWGDRIFDFICLDSIMGTMKNKKESIKNYNEKAEIPVKINRETEIRFAFAMGLLALIQEVEKYYRYTPRHFGWYRNLIGSNFYYAETFRVLKNG